MLDGVKKTILYDQNAIYFGFPIARLMEKAGEGIAKEIIKKYGQGRRIAFFCGPGNNGGDGFAAARYLMGQAEPVVYLAPDKSEIKTKESRLNWQRFEGEKYDNAKAVDIKKKFDVVVECLLGTGIKGGLREPYVSIVRKINKIKAKKVAIDVPAPGFKPDLEISMMFAKAKGAKVVDIGYPKELAGKVGVGEVKVLNKPEENSHKGGNGRLLIIAGSKKYHGALSFAIQAAGKIVDMIYIYTDKANRNIIEKLKPKQAEFISIEKEELTNIIKNKVDAALVGPGLDESGENKDLVNKLIKKYKTKKFILDATALRLADKSLLNKNHIITPHQDEFKALFGLPPTKANIKKMAKRHKATIVLKGRVDFVCNEDECKINTTGNAGMTKGGTGDVLAGLIAGLAARNDLFLSASAGVFINGLAGDRLAKRVASYYSASDLVKEIPRTIKWCLDY